MCAVERDRAADRRALPRTRLSLLYLAGYLLPIGLTLMLAPQLAMRLLLTNHVYDDLGLRLGGVFLFALGMIVVSMIRNAASEMYTTTLVVRAFIIAAVLILYGVYADPALLIIAGIVLVGWIWTLLAWRKDTSEPPA